MMRLLIAGPIEAGKTTLTNALLGRPDKARKTQMIQFLGNCVDTPGEYLEIPRFYRSLFVSAQQADLVLMVIAADACRIQLPQGLAQGFSRPVIGVINKIDLAEADIQRASAILSHVGVKGPYHAVSALTGEGLSELQAAIKDLESGLIKAKEVKQQRRKGTAPGR